MTARRAQATGISDELVGEVCDRLAAGKRVRRTLPGGGRLHIDRPLPFLCVYRQPGGRPDGGTSQLVKGEAAFLIGSGAASAAGDLRRLVTRLAEQMADRFGSFLIVEVWSAPDRDVAEAAGSDDLKPTELRPDFAVSGADVARQLIDSFSQHLRRVSLMKQTASVEVDHRATPRPAGMEPLLRRTSRKPARATLGVCVRPIYRDYATGEVYPAVLRSLKRGLGRALKQVFFRFATSYTSAQPAHYLSLGRRAIVKAVLEVDRRLSQIGDRFDFLLQVTPVNTAAAWRDFQKSRFSHAPQFYYRPLAVEPPALKRLLYSVPIENIEDPTLGELFRQRQDELDRKITMLADVGTPRFLLGSLQVFGAVARPLYRQAREILSQLQAHQREESAGAQLSADEFAQLARQEVEYYRQRLPSFTAQVEIREDMFSGLLCSAGNLLIGHHTTIPKRRALALLQHEVGTHLLTYYNGKTEAFKQLYLGFAGYDALQEGLAVLTEYLVDGLTSSRLRLLAARVIAAHLMTERATFIETFRAMSRDYGFSERTAFTLTMRIYRGGGLTKDAVYLRGLGEILHYLKGGGDLEPLFIGKIAGDHIPLIRELQLRGVLSPPAVRPRYLELPGTRQRLERLRNGVTMFDLVQDNSK